MRNIFFIIALIAMIGTTMAWNPSAITIRECTQEDEFQNLIVPIDTSAPYWLTQNSTGTIKLTPTGYIFEVNPDLTSYKKGNLYFYDVNGQRHVTTVTVYPCVDECMCEPNDPGNNIRIGTPVVGYSIPVSWLPPGSNGDWKLYLYEAGVLNRDTWTGKYPIEVIAKEMFPDTNIPTGFEISDCICG